MLFHKEPSQVEVLNDLDDEIVNLFVCQLHYEELVRYLHFVLVSRKWHELLKATESDDAYRCPASSPSPVSPQEQLREPGSSPEL